MAARRSNEILGVRVLLVGNFTFPQGSAAASRIRYYARGLLEVGVQPHVLAATGPRDVAMRSGDWLVSEEGIRFTTVLPEQMGGERPANRIRTAALLLSLRQAFARRVESLLDRRQIDVVIAYGQVALLLHPVLQICQKRSIPCVMEVNEWQAFDRFRGGRSSPMFWDREWFRLHTLPYATGAIAISKLWEAYVQRLGRPVLRIPALIADQPAFPWESAKERSGRFLVTYLGELNSRDLPQTMFQGIRLAVAAGVDLKLVVIGKAEQTQDGRKFVAAAKADPILMTCVEFTGWVSRSEIQRRFGESDALVLLRPLTRETSACFPMRIPEYLITGRPAVLSAVGDLPSYLTDAESAILLPPGDQPDAFARALTALSADPGRARTIGERGRAVAMREFGYQRHGRRLHEFLASLTGSRTRQEIRPFRSPAAPRQ